VSSFQEWKEVLLRRTCRFHDIEDLKYIPGVREALKRCVKRGIMETVLVNRSQFWVERYFILTHRNILVLEAANLHPQIMTIFPILSTTKLENANTEDSVDFTVVSADNRVLQLRGRTVEVAARWISSLNEVISYNRINSNRPELMVSELESASLSKADLDEFYTVEIRHKHPVLVFRRAKEWVVVRTSDFQETGVHVGSVLVDVNGSNVSLMPFDMACEKLKIEWKLNNKLTFRRAPHKSGYLLMQYLKFSFCNSITRCRYKTRPVYKSLFFVLNNGRLRWKENDSNDVPLMGDVRLRGATAVSLCPCLDEYCFRVSLHTTPNCKHWIIKAGSEAEMMDWASTLHHAIRIAQGGDDYIMAKERGRVRLLKVSRLNESLDQVDGLV